MSNLATDIQDPDANLWVKFYTTSVQNNFRTEKEGHPCFDEKVYISIISPGDPNNKVDRPAKDADKERFHRQWANFERGQSEKVEGMPIEQWPMLNRAQADELKYLGVRSVEQLVAASDLQLQKIMGGVSLREKAKVFLAVAKDTAEVQRVAEANRILTDRIAALEHQLAQLGAAATIQQPAQAPATEQTAAPKRRGRPPKSTTGEQS